MRKLEEYDGEETIRVYSEYDRFCETLADFCETMMPQTKPVVRGRAVMKILFDSIAHEVRTKGKFRVPGFGSFYRKTARAHTIQNPVTRAPMDLPAQETVGFRAAKIMKRKF